VIAQVMLVAALSLDARRAVVGAPQGQVLVVPEEWARPISGEQAAVVRRPLESYYRMPAATPVFGHRRVRFHKRKKRRVGERARVAPASGSASHMEAPLYR
jgi:hypothetical protein